MRTALVSLHDYSIRQDLDDYLDNNTEADANTLTCMSNDSFASSYPDGPAETPRDFAAKCCYEVVDGKVKALDPLDAHALLRRAERVVFVTDGRRSNAISLLELMLPLSSTYPNAGFEAVYAIPYADRKMKRVALDIYARWFEPELVIKAFDRLFLDRFRDYMFSSPGYEPEFNHLRALDAIRRGGSVDEEVITAVLNAEGFGDNIRFDLTPGSILAVRTAEDAEDGRLDAFHGWIEFHDLASFSDERYLLRDNGLRILEPFCPGIFDLDYSGNLAKWCAAGLEASIGDIRSYVARLLEIQEAHTAKHSSVEMLVRRRKR